jgi:hypothetical protein
MYEYDPHSKCEYSRVARAPLIRVPLQVPSQIMGKICYVVRNFTANQNIAPPRRSRAV